ncbi:MAG: Gfo/Idh/MocA family oxidoreductase [Chthonomonadales bacterium]|nr:Gfo/Idh/MocA family oxidoreductase [Chthonomonadales bacterium]
MDRLRIGVIGVGGRGGLWRHWHRPTDGRSIVVGGADPSEAARGAFVEQHGDNPFAAADYRALLDRDDVDAVAVCSPDYCHEEQAIAVLAAGKHLFLEKPMAITTQGCDRILGAWRAAGVRMMVGFNMRYMRLFRVMREIVESGTIGEVRAVWVRHFVGYGGDFYYHDWHATRANTTSLLLQKGSHDIDMIHWLTGRYTRRVAAFGSLDFYGGAMPNDLTCDRCDRVDTCTEAQPESPRRQCAFRSEVDVEDNQVMILELEGGIKAAYLQCHFTPDYHRNYVVIGTEGRVENSEPDMKVWVRTRSSNSDRELADRTYDVKPARGGHGGADPVICRDFVEVVLDGREPVATPLAGRMSVAAGCAGAESLRSGGSPVTVPSPPFQTS